MVKIIEVSEEELETTDDETTEEEDNDDDPPEPPDPPDPRLAPIMFLAPESSGPDGAAADPSSGVVSPMLRVGLSRQYVWHLLRKYSHSLELNGSLQEAHNGPIIAEGLSNWAAESQQLAGPPNGRGDPQFTCSISAPDTPDSNTEDNRNMENAATAFMSATNISVPGSSSQVAELAGKDEGNKIKCDESTKEKRNIVGEKAHLAPTAAGAKVGLSSPDLSLSDYELSDVSDSLAPPDYESLQAALNQEYTAPSGLKECAWSKDVGRDSSMDDPDPEMNEPAAGKEPSEVSDDGEAAALPASSVVKDCWEEWIDDNRLFTLAADVPVASSSAEISARASSPASPKTDRHRTKLENRQRVHQLTAQPVKRFIFVPTEKIGRIVGKGGRRIREIEKESGAKIKIEHKKSAKPVTQITLTGTEEEISKADEEICVIIRNFKPPKSGEPTTASVSSVEESELKRLLLGIKNQVLDGEKRCRKPAD